MFSAKTKTKELLAIEAIDVTNLSPTLIRDQFDATCRLPFFNRGNSEETKKLLTILDLCRFEKNNPANSKPEELIIYNYYLCCIARKIIEKWYGWRKEKSSRAPQLQKLMLWLADIQKKFEILFSENSISHQFPKLKNADDEIKFLKTEIARQKTILENSYNLLKKQCQEKEEALKLLYKSIDQFDSPMPKIRLGDQEITSFHRDYFDPDSLIMQFEGAKEKYLNTDTSYEELLFIESQFSAIPTNTSIENFLINYKKITFETDKALNNTKNIAEKLPKKYQPLLSQEESFKVANKEVISKNLSTFFNAVQDRVEQFADELCRIKKNLEDAILRIQKNITYTTERINPLTNLGKICGLFIDWKPAPENEFTLAPNLGLRKNAFLLPIFNYALDLDCFDYLLDCYNFTADFVTSGLF